MATINGSNGNDIIDEVANGGSTSAGDEIFAQGGDDRITVYANSGTTTDVVHGGLGTDVLAFTTATSTPYAFTLATDPAGGYSGSFAETAGPVWTLNFDGIEAFDITANTGGSFTLGDGNDRVTSVIGNLNLTMGGGNDFAHLGLGSHVANMGAGTDRLEFDASAVGANVYMTVALSGSLATGYSGVYYMSGAYAQVDFSGVEHFTLTTGDANDTLATGDGDDVITTGAGTDRVTAGMGDDTLNGGADTDALSISFADESEGVTLDLNSTQQQQDGGTGSVRGFESFVGTVTGSGFDDRFYEGVFDYDATFNAGAGNDVIEVARGYDTVNGEAGSDWLQLEHSYVDAATYMTVALSGDLAGGYSGTYYITGAYAQTVFTGIENFVIRTGNAGDTLVTGDGADSIQTNGGNDAASVGKGFISADGGAGTDSLGIDLSDRTAGVTLNLLLTGEQLFDGAGTIRNFESFAGTVVGSAYGDTLIEGNYDYNATINGGGGNDLIQVSRGTDSVDGGTGSDRIGLDYSYTGGNVSMTVALNGSLAAGYAGTYYISGNAAQTSFSNIENFTITTGTGNDTIATGDGNDVIASGDGVDSVTLGRGNDVANGGADTDRLSIDLSDEAQGVTINLLLAGAQQSGGTGAISNFESFAGTVTGSNFNDTLIEGDFAYDAAINGGGGNDVIQVSRGNDTIDGGTGSDRLVLDFGNRTNAVYMTTALSGSLAAGYSGTYYVQGASATTVFSNIEQFTITSGTANDTITTGDGNDRISTGEGNDSVTVGRGADIVDGGAGIDRLSIDLSDENQGVSINLLLEGAQQTGGSGSVTGFETFVGTVNGSSKNDVLIEGAVDSDATFNTGDGNDLVQVSRGQDTVDLGAGTDRLVIDASAVGAALYSTVAISGSLAAGYSGQFYQSGAYLRTTYSGVENFTLIGGDAADTLVTGDGVDILTGNGGNDNINAGGGNDHLTGGLGNDTLDGGAGSDTVHYESASEGVGIDLSLTTAQTTPEGNDTLLNIENAIGSAFDDVLVGNAEVNTLTGGEGADVLDGGTGADRLYGGLGSDTYFVDNSNDRVFEADGEAEGIDTVYASASFSLVGQFAEHIVLMGSASINATGNQLANEIYGNSGNNRLDGGAGADHLAGTTGNDRYVVDNAEDFVEEAAGEGNDTVESSISWTLGDNFENLVLTGTATIDGTGNALDNSIFGNGKSNVLNGGAGADTMTGGTGDDIYFVDNVNDKVVEATGQGSDTVNASVTYSLAGQFAEVLNLTGSAAINGSGNSLDNRIVGNSAVNTLNGGAGNDRLDGGLGADKLIGGLGNDTYVVDTSGDLITELDGEGTDTVEASITYSLAGQYIETLRLTGTANINGAGNSQVNALYGNSGNNQLNGAGGADTMTGGAGNDRYIVDDAGDKVFEANNEGTDTVESSVTFSLAGQYAEILTLTGSAAINGTGNSLNNTLNGNGAVNTLSGGNGNDALHGMLGSDVLVGGAGADNFWFETALGTNNIDKINDFVAVDDTITLDRTVFTGLALGNLNANAFYAGTAAHDADDRIIYDQATGALWWDADGNGAGAAVQFATLVSKPAITAADFFVVA